MSLRHKIMLLALVGLGSPSVAAVLGVTFGVRMTYMDLSFSCRHTDRELGINLNGLIKNGKVVQATVASTVDPSRRTTLSPRELAGIQVATDAIGDYYVTVMPMPPRLILFTLVNGFPINQAIGGCAPTQALVTMFPQGAVYKFRHFKANDYVSQIQAFRGQRQDGTPYAGKVGFYQVPGE